MNRKLLIEIPDKYKQRFASLNDDGEIWNGLVVQFIINVQNYMSQAPFFFSEYTKHTVEHINNVLKISASLIPNKTLEELNANTIAVLIMGIIVHDIGMFIKPDGLEYLLNQNNNSSGELSWKEAWDNYQKQLNHYSDIEIEKYFGNPNNFDINDGLNLTALPSNISIGKLSNWRIRLCGEFLRRVHPRLAQEIVENGFPGKEQTDLFSGINIDHDHRQLIGIVAKSHGMDMSELESELKVFDEDVPEYSCEIPIYYIMSILRLADYLDAGEDRAPHAIMAMQHFESELSYDEFKWNKVVNIIDDWGEKSHERVFVKVELSDIDSKTFLKVEEWLKSVQHELDICWRQISLYYKDQYQFSIRRIDSNIFQKTSRNKLAKRIVIEPAKLSASPEILELLIAPLYGGNYTYGVRELLQNAIDTCRERESIEKQNGNKKYKAKIIVEINSRKKQPYFSITDNGCGMNEEIILKYFLVSGSSYRNSEKWKEKFENKRINRSGRFGIGVLAAFLLGKKVEIETKPLSEEESYLFSITNTDYEQINISRDKEIKNQNILKSKGGTCIRINLKKDLADAMVRYVGNGKASSYAGNIPGWTQWYWLASPEIKYIVNNKTYRNPYGCSHDGEIYGLQQSENWFELKTRGEFDSVWWTPKKDDKIWCNGIYISDESGAYIDQYNRGDFSLRLPSISIMDSQKALDLSLSRDKVQSFPKEVCEELYLENCKLLLSFLMMIDFSQQDESNPQFPFCIKYSLENMGILLFCKYGYNFSICRVLNGIAGQTIWLLYKDGRWNDFPFDKLEGIVGLVKYSDHINDIDDIRDGLFNSFFVGMGKKVLFDAIKIKKDYINSFCDENSLQNIKGKRTFSKRIEEQAENIYIDDFDDDFDKVYNFQKEKYFPYVENIKSTDGDFVIVAREKNELKDADINNLQSYFEVACGYKVLNEYRDESIEVKALLDEYLGNEIWIPYDIEQRIEKFPKFFNPQCDIYKYIEFVSQQCGFYDVTKLNKK